MVLSQELNSAGEAIPGTAGEGSEIFIGPGPHFALGREGEGRRVAAALWGISQTRLRRLLRGWLHFHSLVMLREMHVF